MNNLKNMKPLIIIFLFLGFFTILFLYFYSTNYTQYKEKEAEKEAIEISKTEENNKVDESIEQETINTVSVFETDLEKKKNNNSSKTLKNTGNNLLNNDLISDFKYDILNLLYSGEIDKAIEKGNEIKKEYDFFDKNFSSFEVFIYETINFFDNFSNMNTTEKNNLISKLDSPELILFVYNSLSFKERMIVSKDKKSEIFNEKISFLGLNILKCGTEGLETCGAKNVFFITSDYDGYYIKFSYLGTDYKLYYIKDENSNQTIIMGIDKLDEDITTIEDYLNIYS